MYRIWIEEVLGFQLRGDQLDGEAGYSLRIGRDSTSRIGTTRRSTRLTSGGGAENDARSFDLDSFELDGRTRGDRLDSPLQGRWQRASRDGVDSPPVRRASRSSRISSAPAPTLPAMNGHSGALDLLPEDAVS